MGSTALRRLSSVVNLRPLACALLFLTAAAVISPLDVFPASGRTVLVFAPHPDDEALIAAGVVRQGILNGDSVYVAVATNGDSAGIAAGYSREVESVNAMAVLGLAEQKVIFLGYGDSVLLKIYQATSPTTVYASDGGATATYGNRGLGGTAYHNYLNGSAGPYNRQTLLGDVKALVSNLKPTDIFTTNDYDDNPDHQGLYLMLMEAVESLRKSGLSPVPRIHSGMIHWNWTAWPTTTFTPTTPFKAPSDLDQTPLSPDLIESLPVPAAMQVTTASSNLKRQTIAQYPSQGGSDSSSYLFDFVKKNEFFWVNNIGLNLAPDATVTVSSENTATGQLGVKAVDLMTDGYRAATTTEWQAKSASGAWIQLTWPSSVSVSHVVLHDSVSQTYQVLAGTLTFSNGSSISVGALPNDGRGLNILFSPKTITWVKFTITQVSGSSAGLSEFEVYGKYVSKTANSDPYIVQGPTPFPAGIAPTQSTTLKVIANDVDNDAMTYTWSADGGTIVGNGTTAVFTAPSVTTDTVYTITVKVTDEHGASVTNNAFVFCRTAASPNNIAAQATITDSTENAAGDQQGYKAVDGIVDGYTPDYTREWATNWELAGAWIQLTWSSPQQINEVVLHDRINPTDQIKSGTLTFSDGSSMNVGTLPNDGTGLPVTFSAKTVNWVRFTVTSASGSITGLAEIEVWRVAGSSTPTLTSVILNPTSVAGGSSSTGTVALSDVAPSGGASVTLADDSAAITLPASVTVPQGSTSATFTVATSPVTANTTGTITATYNAGSQTAPLTVTAPAALSAVGLSPTSVIGGLLSTGTVTLTGVAGTGGVTVGLTSSNTAVATDPASVTVPAGSSSTTFTVTTVPVGATATSTIAATYNSVSKTAALTVNPPPPLSVATTSLPSGVLGVAYSQSLSATNGTTPYSWSASGLPGGLTMTSGGTVSGTPTSAGTFSVTVTVTDDVSATASATLSLTIVAALPLAIDANVSTDSSTAGTSITSPTVTTAAANELLVAFIGGSDNGTIGNTVTAVANSGATLTWTLAVRKNTQHGTAEIWWAYATSPFTGAVTATMNQSVSSRSITVVSFTGSAAASDAVGATGSGSSGAGAPTASLVTTRAGSWVFGAGNDYSSATSRTVGTNQTMVHPYLASTGDTYWVQRQAGTTASAGTTVTINDTAPAGDSYNLAIVEIRSVAGPAALASVSLSPTSVLGGNTSTGTVTLTAAAPTGGATVTVTDDNAAITVPASVTVPQGSTTATFTVSTVAVAGSTTGTITASYGGVGQSATLTVTAPALSSVSLSPTSLVGGTASTGTVTLTGAAPSGGMVVTLKSSKTTVATVPASVTVPAGSKTATFTISTVKPTVQTSVTMTATSGSTSKTATLTVKVSRP